MIMLNIKISIFSVRYATNAFSTIKNIISTRRDPRFECWGNIFRNKFFTELI